MRKEKKNGRCERTADDRRGRENKRGGRNGKDKGKGMTGKVKKEKDDYE